jgi:hypothetical protein
MLFIHLVNKIDGQNVNSNHVVATWGLALTELTLSSIITRA